MKFSISLFRTPYSYESDFDLNERYAPTKTYFGLLVCECLGTETLLIHSIMRMYCFALFNDF